MARPKQRTPELKDRVLHAAVSTLADAGISGFTTRRVAENAATSIPAVYELFGDRAGLVRGIFFEGFRKLGARFGALRDSDDPRADLLELARVFRAFVAEAPVLAEVMFSRPFTDFDPGREEVAAGASVREAILRQVRRAIDAGLFAGDAIDIAHALLALLQGLAAQESAGWLGTSKASRDRRWTIALSAMIDGLGSSQKRRAGERNAR